jgi:multiple antibiotic resistance protein
VLAVLDINEFIKYFAALFAVINPVAVMPLVIAFTPGGNTIDRVKLCAIASLTVLVVLSVAAWLGEEILEVFAISVNVFRMAGGLLILLTALTMLRPAPSAAPIHTSDRSPAIVPLGIPLLAGPGAIATAIAFANHPHPQWDSFLAHGMAIAAVAAVTFVCLVAATPLQRILGETGMRVVTQIMGLILAAIGIEMIFHGLTGRLGWDLGEE